jgi:hypothetical protein
VIVVREYRLDGRPWQTVGIPDGWRPAGVRLDEDGTLWLAAIVDTEVVEEPEIIRCLRPEQSMTEIQEREGVELALLGGAGGVYVFLDLPPEPVRRIGRLDLEKSQDRE